MISNSVFKRMAIPNRLLFFLLALAPIVAFGWRAGDYVAVERPVSLTIDTTTIEASICANQVYEFNGTALTTAGVYVATLPASSGEDSVVVLSLTVNPLDTIYFNSALCSGDSLLFGDSVLTESGVYTYLLPAGSSVACDTLVSLTLEVYPVSTNVQEVSICEGSVYIFNGDTLNAPGTYTASYSSGNGCDSLFVLHLTWNSLDTTLLSAAFCSGGSYQYDTVQLTSAGVFTFNYQNTSGCDSVVVLTLEELPVFTDSQAIALCPGSFYVFGSDTISTNGTYTYVETAANGCDSMVVLAVTIQEVDTTLLSAVVCAGEHYVFNGDTLSISGNYLVTLAGSNGCDSLLVLDLTVLPELTTDLSASICDGSSYIFGNDTLSVAGVYTGVFPASTGCDSTVVLSLTVVPTSSSTVSATICEGDEYEYEGQIFELEGTYSFTYMNELGCDSVVQLILTVVPSAVTSEAIVLCAGEVYYYEGDTLSLPGVYTYEYVGANGCDSTYQLEISTLPVLSTTVVATICTGTTYAFNGMLLDSSGVYSAVLTSVEGCDSTVVLQLTTVDQYFTSFSATICVGSNYEFNGTLLQDPGIYVDTLLALGGCDSIITLELKVLPVAFTSTTATTCADTPFFFNGAALEQSGTYTAVLTGSNGCDSTVVLDLVVLPINSLSVSGVICQGETYELNGNLFTASGNYTLVSIGANGCTEILELSLEVLPVLEEELSVAICAGSSYVFGGQELTQSGTYEMIVTSSTGCDSIVQLNLEVLPVLEEELSVVICAGSSYVFGNQELTQTGTYDLLLTSSTGCDSTIRLNLSVLPVATQVIEASTCAGTPYEYNNLLLTAEGVYSFVYPSVNGCDSTVWVVLTYYTQHPQQTIELPLCAGSSVVIGGQEISAAGVYEFNFDDVNGCDSLVRYVVTQVEVNADITLQGTTLVAVEVPGNTYQWVDCNGFFPIPDPSASASSFTPSYNGSFAVQITNALGCVALSPCIEVMIVSTNASKEVTEVFSVYPNPAVGTVVLSCEGCSGASWTMQLRDVHGRLLLERFLAESWSGELLDLGGYPAGLYMLQLSNGDRVVNKQLLLMSK